MAGWGRVYYAYDGSYRIGAKTFRDVRYPDGVTYRIRITGRKAGPPVPRVYGPPDPAGSIARQEKVAAILRRRADGESLESIAKDYGVTRERIRQIILKSLREAPDAQPAAEAE